MAKTNKAKDQRLLDEFVSCFDRFDDLSLVDKNAAFTETRAGWIDGFERWRPVRVPSDPAMLAPLYDLLPGPFPPLYEQLVLSYRWLEVDLESLRLLANKPAASLAPLMEEIRRDPILTSVLIPKGFIQFAKAENYNYDPICFDTNRPTKYGDYPVIRFEHESILCNEVIGESTVIAPSFRSIVNEVIEIANRLKR